jgi:hypothetical protein
MYNIENNLFLENYNLFVKETTIDDNLRLIKYNKKNCPHNKFNILRSVIVDKYNNCIMFSPPRSIPLSVFMQKYNLSSCTVEYFIEGTMINLFWNSYKEEWDIATKSVYGGVTSTDDGVMTFDKMFYECVKHTGLDISILDRNITWSFVMQHPSNMIVNPILTPMLYLVECYKTDATIPNKLPIIKINDIDAKYKELPVKFANKLPNNTSYSSLTEQINETTSVGIVIKSHDGERCKIMNNQYKYIHELLCNTSNKLLRFLRLNENSKVNEYLKYYPEDKSLYDLYNTKFNNIVTNSYNTYVSCFIKKEMRFKDLDNKIKPIIWNIHEVYKKGRIEYKHFKMHRSNVYNVINKNIHKYIIINNLA